MLPNFTQELSGGAGSPNAALLPFLALLVFLGVGLIGLNFPKYGKPVMGIMLVVLIVEAVHTGV